MTYSLVVIVVFLAYANGANDNFKGVATLLGSGVTDYRKALIWGTATTFLGALTALFIAKGLLATFSGQGLVPPPIAASPVFILSVGLGAALTVILAVFLGFPISTTHSLVGGLVGVGYLASASGVNLGGLWGSVFKPLLFSPFIALLLALVLYPLFHFVRKRLGVERDTCVCVGDEVVARFAESPASALAAATVPSVTVGTASVCRQHYTGRVVGIETGRALDVLHYLSAGAVSFARGVNDTPKIAAILLIVPGIGANVGIIITAVAMAAGGLLSARRVAETMAHKITAMNAGQGFTANLVTSLLVIVASRFGLPVSTTQVSVGALFGIGTVTRQAQWKTISGVVLSWIITLPVAAALSAAVYFIVSRFV
ncbi:MAG TPA: anion permease [Nitrococcus sp.]|nr:anion permease [Nitrococcus sp.]